MRVRQTEPVSIDPTHPRDPGSQLATWVVLLRGINVGGRNRVPMAELRAGLSRRGLTDVRTYIASGNIVLRAADGPDARPRVAGLVEQAVTEDFGVRSSALVRPGADVRRIAAAIPTDWVDDADRRCDVLFLFDDVDAPEVLDSLPLVAGVDTAHYTPGAVLWSVPRDRLTRTGMTRIVGTSLYPRLTIRNIRTTRTLAELAVG